MRSLFNNLTRNASLAATLFVCALSVQAETVTESFEGVSTVSPDTWGRAGKLSNGWVCTNKLGIGNSNDYSYYLWSKGHTGNKALGGLQGSKNNDYIVCPTMLTGEVSFYIVSTSSDYRSTGNVRVYYATDNGDGTYTIGSQISAYEVKGNSSYPWQQQTIKLSEPTLVAFKMNRAALDDFSYEKEEKVEGPALAIKDYDTDEISDFGIVDPGTTKTFTLTNPGSEDVNITLTTTGGYTVTPETATIAAKGEQQVTVTVTETSTAGTLTITPAEAGVEAITVKLDCMVKDPQKMFEDFSSGELPDYWETAAIGSYTTGEYASSYVWKFTDGCASYRYTGQTEEYAASYFHSLITPKMIFQENEKLMFKVKKNVQFDIYIGVLYVEYSTDKTEWTTATDGHIASSQITDEWTQHEVTLPATAKYVRFKGAGITIDEVYGGMQANKAPLPKLEVLDIENGGTLSWGFADLPAGSEKTITLKNAGKADLNVTFTTTNDYTLSAPEAVITAQGGTYELIIGTPAHDGPGLLTITPSAESTLSPYLINLTSYYKVPKAIMAVDKREIAFGKLRDNASDTITVSNSGDAELVAIVGNDNKERFVTSADTLRVPEGESCQLAVTYQYDPTLSGIFTANITLTPLDGTAHRIVATANNKKAGVWSEDFEEGIPTTWHNDGWTISRKWNEDNSVNHAYADPNSGYLITPRLKAVAGEELTFDFVSNYAEMKMEYAHHIDATEWTMVDTFTVDSTITFVAPKDSVYYLRFSGSGAYLDNFEGFVLDLLTADAAITESRLPEKGNQFVEYQAAVTVQNKGTEAQTAIARLLINGIVCDSVEAELPIEGTVLMELTFTPDSAITDGTARIEVSLKGVSDFVTKSVETILQIAPAPTLDENIAGKLNDETLPVAIVKYTAEEGWNSITMPFVLTPEILTTFFGEDWEAYELKGFTGNTIRFQQTTTFVAGYPYLIHATSVPTQPDGFILEEIVIADTTANYDAFNGVKFEGTYAPLTADQLTGKYLVAQDSTLMACGDSATLKGFRGVLSFEQAITTLPTLVFCDSDGIPTRIETMTRQPGDKHTYNLHGQRVTPRKKGLYIQRGKKILLRY